MRKLYRRVKDNDRGAALALVAASLVVLMGMAAFGSDLAWFYLNASRIQRAADAAALGGVVWLPGQVGTANSTAVDIALRNGYDDSLVDVDVTPGGPRRAEPSRGDDPRRGPHLLRPDLRFRHHGDLPHRHRRVHTTIEAGKPRQSVRQHLRPEKPGCTGQANFWANIHGKWTDRGMGDAYSSWCDNANDNPGCAQNALARSGGYLYGIESGGSFTVQFNDLAFHNISGGNPTSDDIRTGDRGCEPGTWGNATATCGPTMVVSLYAPDPTPLDISDNALLCQATIPPQPQVPDANPYSFSAPDGQSCWTQSGSGIYVLEVRHLDPGGTVDRAGLNRYSVRSSSGNLYALGDFSIYNNFSGSVTSFYLAEVPTYYHGKTFVIELYDPGESSANGTLQVVGPDGSVFNDGECRIYDRSSPTAPWSLQQTINAGSSCQELVTPQEYHRRWLKFEIDLPPEYTCTTCWWKMNYVYTSPVNDTTTWRAYMIGNPIHFVPST